MDGYEHQINTVNDDVGLGITFYANQLYQQRMRERTSNRKVTATVFANTRTVQGYQSIEEILEKGKIWKPWRDDISTNPFMQQCGDRKFLNIPRQNPGRGEAKEALSPFILLILQVKAFGIQM
ncbi:hypothetical protein ACLOJK_013621 [Asimina triloba]